MERNSPDCRHQNSKTMQKSLSKMRVKFYNRLLQESNKKNCSFEADLKEIGSSDEVMKKLFLKEKGDERKKMNNFDAESPGFDDWLLNDHEIILAYNEDYYIKGL